MGSLLITITNGEKVRASNHYPGTHPPSDLEEKVNRRKLSEKQRKTILSELSIIARTVDTLHITAGEIIKVFSENTINVMLIGSYCLPVIKEKHDFNLPTVKTGHRLSPGNAV